MEFVRVLTSLGKNQYSRAPSDDAVDRMHWKLTPGLLVVFALVVSTKQYVGDPIECWCPAQFTSNYVSYVQNLCWVKNTFYIPLEKDIPRDEDARPQLVYYQWVPFILLFQALLFVLPWLLWRSLIASSGVDVSDIVDAGRVFAFVSKYESRDKSLGYICKQLRYYLEYRKPKAEASCLTTTRAMCTKGKGNYLAVCYLITKLLFFANACSQFFLLNFMLGTDYEHLGVVIMRSLLRGEHLPDSPQFPRITLCDFSVRQAGPERQPYIVECVLSINLFNEKIFIFIWFWLIILCAVTGISFLVWVYRLLLPCGRREFIRRHLKIADCYRGESKRVLLYDFVGNYLHSDGLLLIRLLANNANDLVASEVTRLLWLIRREGNPSYPSAPLEEIGTEVDNVHVDLLEKEMNQNADKMAALKSQ